MVDSIDQVDDQDQREFISFLDSFKTKKLLLTGRKHIPELTVPSGTPPETMLQIYKQDLRLFLVWKIERSQNLLDLFHDNELLQEDY